MDRFYIPNNGNYSDRESVLEQGELFNQFQLRELRDKPYSKKMIYFNTIDTVLNIHMCVLCKRLVIVPDNIIQLAHFKKKKMKFGDYVLDTYLTRYSRELKLLISKW